MEVSGLYLGSGLLERCVGHSFDMPQPGLVEHHSKMRKKHLQRKHGMSVLCSSCLKLPCFDCWAGK